MTDYQFKYLLELQSKCEEKDKQIASQARELEQLRAEIRKLKAK